MIFRLKSRRQNGSGRKYVPYIMMHMRYAKIAKDIVKEMLFLFFERIIKPEV
jgi:hypothetical protein